MTTLSTIFKSNAHFSMPCSVCGQPVIMQNDTAVKLARQRGITCKDCLQTPTWTKETYNEYLQSDHWKAFREKALKYYGRKCYLCGVEDGQIDIHHNDYTRLGCERMSDVIPLCHDHHTQYEEANNGKKNNSNRQANNRHLSNL